MSRRSTPQAKIDRHAWPVTVRILIPEGGFSSWRPKVDLDRWLQTEFGLTEYATTPGESMYINRRLDVLELHFRTLEAAVKFRDAFPMAELADGTTSSTYQSPHLPFGRSG